MSLGYSKIVTQVSNKGSTLFKGSRERSRVSIKSRRFEGSIDPRGGSMVYFVRGEDCWEGVPHWLIKGMIMGL